MAAKGCGADPRFLRAAECALFFGVLPGFLAWLRWRGSSVPVLGSLFIAAFVAWIVLRRDPGFDRRELLRWEGSRRVWLGILLRFAAGTVLLLGLVFAAEPDRWFEFPRHRPLLWALVMVLYPLLSVYPQELLFRVLFFQRYRALWGDGRVAVLASALAFAWAHAMFLSWLALALSLAGGWVFARTFQRTRSLPVVCLEHALYGCLVFTIGLGRHFFAGS